jgi:hypothetical protein
VVGHDDEGVEFVVSFSPSQLAGRGPRFGAVVLEGFDEEFGVAFDLKEAAAVVGSAGDEEGAGAGRDSALREKKELMADSFMMADSFI